ncbi:hypothetical protein RhiirA4_472349 [Rhizophagus irregularis]|uniref:Uncharacterized protein n=1 Tax=Rhizophagus irregularis TaxID=588596 RepID=A0A2I1H4S6_9GLOM|nr:hypothetical protein RhiirA4_472349 [Rhizophagus irregularis]
MESVYLTFTSIIQHIYTRDVSNEWLTSISGIKNKNYWCPHCTNTKFDISIAKSIAYSQNGEYLSDFYTNYNTWCPYCFKYKCERLCQEIMSKYLRLSSKIRQSDFLKTLNHPIGLELYSQCGFYN